ncbi:uncharacterized protein LOC8278294 [Ricinus communis]|uniref:ATP binding protein, putative n=1 Tax=Ricinus communis TaxID=3988 RepID=B9RAV3_RICCO|nr:uncharacterized protein LOC8278294 [Ricinus communis]EEF51930.1 ATP binding protein, putative [Ricinus communis]|eukprot:XP_002511328.1 uncharacterized protein LOC8278294 [Ricinus communis]
MVRDSSESKRSTLKFLCSYGGKIVPRSIDGSLRYVGGLTRVLAVDRSISFAELMVKLGEFCGYSVELRCQLPNGDLETLISIKSEEELRFLIEEYNRNCRGSKIRAVLTPPKSLKTISPPPSTPSSVDLSPTKSKPITYGLPIGYPISVYKDTGRMRYNSYFGQGNPRLGCCDSCCYRNWH